MIGNPNYARYRPQPYRRRMPIFWWLGKAPYTKFIVRELTSLGVAYAVLMLLALAGAAAHGPEAFDAVLAWLRRPWAVGVNVLALLALLFHTVTWLNLAPKALVLKLGRRRLPDRVVLAAHYAAWIAASALVVWGLLGAAR
ncbi:MAG: fumarate reductase subunit C [Thermoanaerobaculia bacterium]